MDYKKLEQKIKKVKIKSLLINHDHELVFNYYKNNKQIGKLQRINSCTKSVISLLFGIMLDQKIISSLDIPIVNFFPEMKFQEDQRKLDITIYHLLTMTDGFNFPEFGEWNYFAPMNYQKDLVKFVLDRPIDYKAGTHMNYSSGDSHLLSAIIQIATGMKTDQFAIEYLFKPLGIYNYHWDEKNNIILGADGLKLRIEDMIKIGELMLNNGFYNGKTIISQEWFKKVTEPLFFTYKNIGYYGLHWWINKLNENQDFSFENTFYFALGYGGQYIIVIPKENLVIAIISEIYNDSILPLKLVKECL